VLDSLCRARKRGKVSGLTPIEDGCAADGCAVVATVWGRVLKLVVQANRLLVDPDNSRAWRPRHAMPCLTDALAASAEAGRSYVVSDFSIAREAAALVRIYR